MAALTPVGASHRLDQARFSNCPTSRRQPFGRSRANRCTCAHSVSERDGTAVLTEDPEAKFRRYGAHFGAKYSIDLGQLVGNAPRVRRRNASDRQQNLLAELTVLNERLAGNESWEIRQKLEHLKCKRKNWALIYEYVTKQDAFATLARIEEANTKVSSLRQASHVSYTPCPRLRHVIAKLPFCPRSSSC